MTTTQLLTPSALPCSDDTGPASRPVFRCSGAVIVSNTRDKSISESTDVHRYACRHVEGRIWVGWSSTNIGWTNTNTYNAGSSLALALCGTSTRPPITEEAIYSFVRDVRKVGAVKAVSYAVLNDTVQIWTFIPERDKLARSAIYDVEFELMGRYPSLKFDFNVISLDSVQQPAFTSARRRLMFYRG